ncbi:MAG TPA: hypothetical protein VGR28_04335 [Candidatus Thermoplasmatota archaeon]|jgi:electron transfer flavoprotein beta subunit|nr:hypothetical protein [Candidatus Thermoplasmatota archaeon]
MMVVACVKPTRLGEPRLERGRALAEGSWGLAPGERRALAAARVAAGPAGQVIALAAGPADAAGALREALALGAARGVLVEHEGALEALPTARALAAAIAKLGAPPVAVVAERSADAQQGLVGPLLAELLDRPFLGGVERLRVDGEALEATSAGARSRARPPLVLAAGERFAPAPHATSWGVGAAFEAPLDRWTLAELGVAAPTEDVQVLSAARAGAERRDTERFEGDPDEAAAQLARRWRAAGVAP